MRTTKIKNVINPVHAAALLCTFHVTFVHFAHNFFVLHEIFNSCKS